MQKFNFDYDQNNDSLFLYLADQKSKGSVEFGDFVFDFNSKKELVGMEFQIDSYQIAVPTLNEIFIKVVHGDQDKS